MKKIIVTLSILVVMSCFQVPLPVNGNPASGESFTLQKPEKPPKPPKKPKEPKAKKPPKPKEPKKPKGGPKPPPKPPWIK